MTAITLLTVVVLAAFIGYELIPDDLAVPHIWMLSGLSIINGVILIALTVAVAKAAPGPMLALGLVAIVLVTITLVSSLTVLTRTADAADVLEKERLD